MNDLIGKKVLGRTPNENEQPNILQDYANTSSAGSIIAFSKYSKGMKKDELNYSSGKLDGTVSRWYENGNKSEEGTYKLGKQAGSWTWYFVTGI